MEETGTNIHMGLVRRNNFLRENPILGQIVAVFLKADVWRGFPPMRGAMTEQELGRSVSADGLDW
jgi:hypothetical protein